MWSNVTKRSTLILAMLVLAAIGLAALVAFKGDVRDSVPGALGSLSPEVERPAVLPSVAPSALARTDTDPKETRQKSDSMAAEYRDAADLRIFVEKAKQRPERGGALYAAAALFECSLLRDAQSARLSQLKQQLSTDRGAQAAQRLAALQWLEQRCVGFTTTEVSLADEAFLREWGQGKDALLALKARVMKANPPDDVQRRQLLTEVLATGEPLLLPLVQGLATAPSDDRGGFATFLDGQPYAGLDAEGFAAAWRLMSCQVTSSCALRDSQLMQQCAFDGRCAQSIEAGVRIAAHSTKEYERIQAVAERLTQVIKGGDPTPLLPPQRTGQTQPGRK
jgi:hypothetical protein